MSKSNSRRIGWGACLVAGALVMALATTNAAPNVRHDVSRMTAAADAWLDSLTADQRSRANFELPSDERLRWNFIPNEMFERHGLMLKEMSSSQSERARDLLRAGLSQRGYLTATQVMALEDVLKATEGGGRFARDHDEYFLTVFGRPDAETSWGWRFEGHHLSLHFTIVDGLLAVSSPAFVGANPAEVREGPQQGRRVLADREDMARELLESLDDGQRQTATISDVALSEIVTGANVGIDPLSPPGIAAGQLSPAQRGLLMKLIEVYLNMMNEDIARRRLALVHDGDTDAITFAWAGSYERGKGHYYRVQGPTFLIEYDNTQNDANHIHSVWRDFDGDFGRDLLREHLRSQPH